MANSTEKVLKFFTWLSPSKQLNKQSDGDIIMNTFCFIFENIIKKNSSGLMVRENNLLVFGNKNDNDTAAAHQQLRLRSLKTHKLLNEHVAKTKTG